MENKLFQIEKEAQRGRERRKGKFRKVRYGSATAEIPGMLLFFRLLNHQSSQEK
jgi:hypothetical protein